MQVFDRYLLRLFLKVLLICMFSITGLYVVIDYCNNMDEFLGYGKEVGYLYVVYDYYGARVPWFFDRTSGLLTLIAAMFAITWLQRTNEMTALLAAGIPKSRILRPLIVAAACVSLLAAGNRELIIPKFRAKLLRNAQNWLGDSPRAVTPVYDHRTDILLSGAHAVSAESRIDQPNFQLRQRYGEFGRKLVAEQAYYAPPDGGRPGGYLLRGVQQPAKLDSIASAYLANQPVILSPRDTAWLNKGECFVVSDISFEQLSAGFRWRQFASTGELLAGLRNPSRDYGADVRVSVHSRVMQPLLDMSLFFLGIPLVLTRESRNIFVAAGWCVLVVLGFFLVVLTCQAMGNNGYLLNPAQAAWCPLILMAPLATAAASPIWE